MRRFDTRKQKADESISEYAQALKLLHKDAWPSCSSEQRDSELKRRFEDGILSLEMGQYLHLHARNDVFGETVTKARHFESLSNTSTKKSVKIVANTDIPSVNTINSGNVDNILESIETIVEKVIARQNRPRSPAPNGSKQNSVRVQTTGFRGQSRQNDSALHRQPVSTRDHRGLPIASDEFRGQSGPPGNAFRSRGFVSRSSDMSRGGDFSAVSRPTRSQWPHTVVRPNSQAQRRGCWICGRFGCHSRWHERDTMPNSPRERTQPIRPPSRSESGDESNRSGNGRWVPQMGIRMPPQISRPASR